MSKITDGEKLFVTAHYSFNYNESQWDHLVQFDILTQFFEHRNGLEGYISDEKGDRIEQGSDIDILTTDLHNGFEDKSIPGVVEKYLHKFEMYEVLSDYFSPLGEEALKYKEELLAEQACI